MNFYSFRLPSPVMQVYWVLKYGTYLAQLWESQGGVNLYHLADEGRFFVEVGIEQEQAVVLAIFVTCRHSPH